MPGWLTSWETLFLREQRPIVDIYCELILGLIMQLDQAPELLGKGLVRGYVLLGLQPPSSSFSLQPQHSRGHIADIVTAQYSGTSGAPGERWA